MFLVHVLLICQSPLLAQDVQVCWLDGLSARGVFRELTNQQLFITVAGAEVERAADQLRTIYIGTNAERSPAGPGLTVLSLANGDQILGSGFTLADEIVQLDAPHLGIIALPLESVKAATFPESADVAFVFETSASTQGGDSVRLKNGDAVRGTILSINNEELLIETSLGQIQIPRETIASMAFDPALLISPEVTKQHQIVEFLDGSWLTCSAVTIDRLGNCQLKHFLDAEFSTRVVSVRKISFYSESMQSLTSRSPVIYSGESYFGVPLSVMTNLNFRQGQLITGGERFLRGLGMTSRTVSTYAIEPEDQFLLVQAGLDITAGDSGRLEMRIEVDRKSVWSSGVITSVSGKLTVPPVPLTGGKSLSLIVDYGPQADIQDLANWCDPVIIRTAD